MMQSFIFKRCWQTCSWRRLADSWAQVVRAQRCLMRIFAFSWMRGIHVHTQLSDSPPSVNFLQLAKPEPSHSSSPRWTGNPGKLFSYTRFGSSPCNVMSRANTRTVFGIHPLVFNTQRSLALICVPLPLSLLPHRLRSRYLPQRQFVHILLWSAWQPLWSRPLSQGGRGTAWQLDHADENWKPPPKIHERRSWRQTIKIL